jgi:uncharacterized protein YndB with AHSA1/START domain
MTIAPIVHTVQLRVPPARAFELFTSRIGEWWPKGRTIGKAPHTAIVIEPRVGGRWFERDAAGNETNWGKVMAWRPPSGVLLAWQINRDWGYDPELITEVELSFAPVAGGGTLVTLEHRNLERFGADAAAHAERLDGGWPGMLGDYAQYSEPQS